MIFDEYYPLNEIYTKLLDSNESIRKFYRNNYLYNIDLFKLIRLYDGVCTIDFTNVKNFFNYNRRDGLTRCGHILYPLYF